MACRRIRCRTSASSAVSDVGGCVDEPFLKICDAFESFSAANENWPPPRGDRAGCFSPLAWTGIDWARPNGFEKLPPPPDLGGERVCSIMRCCFLCCCRCGWSPLICPVEMVSGSWLHGVGFSALLAAEFSYFKSPSSLDSGIVLCAFPVESSSPAS